jgi:hypothetical protein
MATWIKKVENLVEKPADEALGIAFHHFSSDCCANDCAKACPDILSPWYTVVLVKELLLKSK